MALDDIVIDAGYDQAMEEIPLGLLNAPIDILTESNSKNGTIEAEWIIFSETSSVFIL